MHDPKGQRSGPVVSGGGIVEVEINAIVSEYGVWAFPIKSRDAPRIDNSTSKYA